MSETFGIYSLGGIMHGPQYTYFDLPLINIRGTRRSVFNRWTVIATLIVVTVVGIIYSGVIPKPVSSQDKIVWGATVDPTLWEPDDQSAKDVTMSLLTNYSSRPKTQGRGSTAAPSTARIPSSQVVVVAARYAVGGPKMADDNGVFNDQCTIQAGGSVHLIGQHHSQALVGYDPPMRQPASNDSACGTKEVFYLKLVD